MLMFPNKYGIEAVPPPDPNLFLFTATAVGAAPNLFSKTAGNTAVSSL
jgi:hypothetical protein